MTATEKLAMIETALANGQTVYLCTYTRAIEITANNAARFAAAGTPIVKVKGDSLYVASGRKYLCHDYSAIRIAEGR